MASRCTPCKHHNIMSTRQSLALLTLLALRAASPQGTYLEAYVQRCQRIAQLRSIGTSVGGRPLWVLEISGHPGHDDPKPHFKYVANMHGDEPSGRQLLLALAHWLCEHYETDHRARSLVNHVHLHLMPTMNPDGFALHTRNNMNDVDLNRNFPDPIQDAAEHWRRGLGHEQPETRALMNWTLDVGFTAAAALHEGALVANFPWDGTASKATQYNGTAEDATFRHLATRFAAMHKVLHTSAEFPAGITNGAAWYPVYGGMQDWNYINAECMDLTLELSGNKWPAADTLGTLWNDCHEALIRYPLEATLGGITGSVRHAATGQGIAATVAVEGFARNHSTRMPGGAFFRPMVPGSYMVTVAAEGFVTQSRQLTVPDDGNGVRHHFLLDPTSTLSSTSLSTSSVVNATMTNDADAALHRRHAGAASDMAPRVGPLHGVVVVLVAVQLYAAAVWIGRRVAKRGVRGALPPRHSSTESRVA